MNSYELNNTRGSQVKSGRAGPAEIQERSLVAVHHRSFREAGFNRRARLVSHPSANRPVREDRQLVDEGSRIAHGKEKAVAPGDDHLRGAAHIRMDHGLAQAMASIAARENASVKLHKAMASQAAI